MRLVPLIAKEQIPGVCELWALIYLKPQHDHNKAVMMSLWHRCSALRALLFYLVRWMDVLSPPFSGWRMNWGSKWIILCPRALNGYLVLQLSSYPLIRAVCLPRSTSCHLWTQKGISQEKQRFGKLRGAYFQFGGFAISTRIAAVVEDGADPPPGQSGQVVSVFLVLYSWNTIWSEHDLISVLNAYRKTALW